MDDGLAGHAGHTSHAVSSSASRPSHHSVAWELSLSDQVLDLDSVWTRAIAGLGEDVVSAQQRAWLRLTKPLALVQDTVVLATPNDFARDVLDTRLRPLVVDALSRELARDVRVAVTVEPMRRVRRPTAGTTPQRRRRRARAVSRGRARTGARNLDPSRRVRTGSTRSTSSRPSSSGRATGSPTRPRSRSPRRRPRPTTRCSSTASPGWARPTCCTRSATTPERSCPAAGCGT